MFERDPKRKTCRSCREQIHARARICPHCRSKQGWSTGAKLVFSFFLLFVAFPMCVKLASKEPSSRASGAASSKSSTLASTPTPKRASKSDVMDALKLNYKWWKTGFDNIMEADFTIRNTSSRGVKDIEIECVHYAQSGTQIDRNTRTVYDVVPAGKTRTFPKFNMGFIHDQVKSSSCQIEDVELL